MLESQSVCHQGEVRTQNEDSFVVNEVLGLWLVADGVGGNGHGDVASQLATQAIERSVRQGNKLAAAIAEGNLAISEAIAGDGSLANMATTVVACRFDEHHFELAWVGDSRAYLVDATGIHQLSIDHNVAEFLVQQGELTAQEAISHPGQHELTQALGQLTLEKIPISLGELHHGDYLLLCTDGLSGVLQDQKIYQTICRSSSVTDACECLLKQVLEAGAPDNVTFSLIRYRDEELPIQASDFNSRTFRLPFDRSTYLEHCRSRPMLLLVILLSIVCLLLFI